MNKMKEDYFIPIALTCLIIVVVGMLTVGFWTAIAHKDTVKDTCPKTELKVWVRGSYKPIYDCTGIKLEETK